MAQGGFRRRADTVAAVFREPRLRRVELAWGGYYLGEWAQFIALSIYAFDRGGATAVGVLGFVRMGGVAAALPVGSLLTDRYPRHRVLLASYAVRAVFLATDRGGARRQPVAPAGLRPRDARGDERRARPARHDVARPAARANAGGARRRECLVQRDGRSRDARRPARRRRPCGDVGQPGRRRNGRGDLLLLRCRGLPDPARRATSTCRQTAGRELTALLVGARVLARYPHPRLIVLLFAAQTLVRGLLNVLLTVIALETLGVGRGGLGALNADPRRGCARRRPCDGRDREPPAARVRLRACARPLGRADLPLMGIAPTVVVAFACIAVIGVGNALLDVSGFTLLQRTVDEHVLGRVFGVFEILVALGVAAGSAIGAVAVAQLGVERRSSALACCSRRSPRSACPGCASVDDASPVPERELALLSTLPLFAPLPVTTLERLAQRLTPLHVAAGTAVVRAGEPGDAFFVIDVGEIEVVRGCNPRERPPSGRLVR